MSCYLALALLPVLAACSAAPPATTAQGRCEQQAYQDPAVKALLVKAPAWSGDPGWQEELRLARRKSVNDCLVAAGLAPPGGVQPVARARFGLGWYGD
jgi:hypothetical protein